MGADFVRVIIKPTLESDADQIDIQTLIKWKPAAFWAFITASIGLWAILGLGGVTEFLYFQF